MMSLWLQFHDKLGGACQCMRVLIPLQKVQNIIDVIIKNIISKFLIKVINSGDLDCQAEISPVFLILNSHICYVIAIQIKLCINYMDCQYMVFYIALKKNNH